MKLNNFILIYFLPGFESDEEEPSIKKSKKLTKKQLKGKAGEEHPLITDLDYRNKDEKKTHKAELWFQRDIFKNLIDEKDEDADLDKMVEEYKKKGAKVIGKEEQLMVLNQKCYIFIFICR